MQQLVRSFAFLLLIGGFLSDPLSAQVPPDNWQLSPDGRYLSVIRGKQIRYRSLDDGQELLSSVEDLGQIKAQTISRSGQLIGVVDEFGAARLLNRNDLRPLKDVSFGRPVSKIGFGEDDNSVLVVGTDQTVSWWDTATGELSSEWTFGPDERVNISANGRIAVVEKQGDVAIRDAKSGETIRRLEGVGLVMGLSGDGQSVAILNEGKLRLYSTKSGESRPFSFELSDDIVNFEFSYSGNVFLTNDSEGQAIAYDAWGGNELLTRACAGISRLSSDGTTVVSVDNSSPGTQFEKDPIPKSKNTESTVADDKGSHYMVSVHYATCRTERAVGISGFVTFFWQGLLGLQVLLWSAGLAIVVSFRSYVLHKKNIVEWNTARTAVMAISTMLLPPLISASIQLSEVYRDPGERFGGTRGPLAFGSCDVTIPRDHRIANLEVPDRIFSVAISGSDSSKFFTVSTLTPQSEEQFHEFIKKQITGSRKEEAFVFIHGYNTTFKEAIYRTAQLKYDLEFDGAAIAYSWPSLGKELAYVTDANNVDFSVPHLTTLLNLLKDKTGAKRVHLIAHSMGNRVLTSTLRRDSSLAEEGTIFSEIVLAAPDIDAEVFRTDIAPAIVNDNQRFTLYASSNDGALLKSKQLQSYPRAGDAGQELVVVDGIHTIDVSALDTSLSNHSYYADHTAVITDLYYLLVEGRGPESRFRLSEQKKGGLRYWIFRP